MSKYSFCKKKIPALDRNEALDGALGLVKLALYQLGSAQGAEGEVTSTEGEPA